MVLGEGWSVTPFYYFRMQGLGDYARWTGGRGAILAARLDRCENEGRGLDLCEEWRQTPLDNPKSGELRQAMTNLYRPIYDLLDPSWGATVGRGGKSQDANVALNSASSSSSRPEIADLGGVDRKPVTTGFKRSPGSTSQHEGWTGFPIDKSEHGPTASSRRRLAQGHGKGQYRPRF